MGNHSKTFFHLIWQSPQTPFGLICKKARKASILNCIPIVRQYDILKIKGCFSTPKEKSNKRNMAEFKEKAVERNLIKLYKNRGLTDGLSVSPLISSIQRYYSYKFSC